VKFKHVPPAPASFAGVERARRAVPLVPGSETDCCARLMDRLDLPSRDVARTWLTFLRALELAEETPSGFRRTDVDPTPERCRRALRERVLGVTDLLDTLRDAERPVTVDGAFAAVRGSVPQWERHRDPSRWEDRWRERVAHLLDWLVLLDLAERVETGAGEPRYAERTR
jgi:hypothetical protein